MSNIQVVPDEEELIGDDERPRLIFIIVVL